MLHVTNGSVFLSRLHDLGVPGRVVPWDDVLHEGPVPADLPWEELRRVRAEFLASGWGDVADVERSLEARDRAVMDAMAGDEVVLWFEHDRMTSCMSCRCWTSCSRFARTGGRGKRRRAGHGDPRGRRLRPRSRTGRSAPGSRASASEPRTVGCVSRGLGLLSRARSRKAFRLRPSRAWTSLRAALRRHLQQFPSVRRGLSRTEAQTLAGSLPARWRCATPSARRTMPWRRPSSWETPAGGHIRPLLTSRIRCSRVVGEAPDMNHPDWWRDDASAPRLALTDTGARVMAGEVDHVALNGIDRWLGGVHLVAEPVSGVGSPAPDNASARSGAGRNRSSPRPHLIAPARTRPAPFPYNLSHLVYVAQPRTSPHSRASSPFASAPAYTSAASAPPACTTWSGRCSTTP
jgi:hypothetical protein